MEKNNEANNRLSGGEDENRSEMLALRALILQETDVHECLALSWVPQEGRWLYLIKTPFASWPKFVVGWTNDGNTEVEILFRCNFVENARAAYDEQNIGDHL